MDMQKLLSKLRQCVNDYNLIQDGDKIAVGLSGGKDSVSLLRLLAEYRKFSPQKFDVVAITVDLAFGGIQGDFSALKQLCDELDVQYVIERTQIAEIVFDVRKESNPCSLCSRMRKGALYNTAIANGCNKVALGHHKDDIIDTFFLSMFYDGKISTFAPKVTLQKFGITLIRPMIYINEYELKNFSTSSVVVKSKCPADKKTKREEIKVILNELQEKIPDVKTRISSAIFSKEGVDLLNNINK